MAATDKTVMTVIRASRPSFRNASDKVAFAVHASFHASGYVLTATGRPALSDSALSSSSADEVGIDNWNELEGEYAFVYANPEKGSKKVLVKCLLVNDKLMVDALADGGSEPLHLEIEIKDHVGENDTNNYAAHYKNLDRLVGSLNLEILSKLDGASPSKPSSTQTREESRDYQEYPDVGGAEPLGPQIHPSGVALPPVFPSGGASDLFPGPGAGMYPTRGGFGSGGGMLLGPNDPSWFGGGGQPGFPGIQPGVLPGARFDPYGPPGVPGFEPNRFIRNPRGRRGGGGIHPDLQHFGSGSDFI